MPYSRSSLTPQLLVMQRLLSPSVQGLESSQPATAVRPEAEALHCLC